MKRLLLVWVMMLCILPVVGMAEKENVVWYSGSDEVYSSLGEHFCYEVEDDHAILTKYWVEKGKPQPAVVMVPSEMEISALIFLFSTSVLPE